MRVRILAFFALLGLAACATPRQRCESAVSNDIIVLDLLIAETEANIERGYAIRTERVPYSYPAACVGFGFAYGNFGMCQRTVLRTRTIPEAISVEEQRAQLASMRESRAQKERTAAEGLAQCAARYPE